MALGTLLGGIGAAAGGISNLIGAFGGGGGGGSSSAEADFYAQFGSQAAAANNPLTAAMLQLATLQGGLGGALGQQGTTLASSQLSVLGEALNQAKAKTNTQASEVARLFTTGANLQQSLGQARIGVETLGPQFQAQAAQAAYQGENELAKGLASTNMGLKAAQEMAKSAVAQDQAFTIGDVFQTRANTQGSLALGAQQLESALKLQQAKTLSDLTSMRGQTQAQLALKRFGAGQALAGTRFFA
jgi:hypothetical protein